MAATTVVSAAYDTSGNGGRKLVRLSNGWLVAIVKDNSTNYFRVYKSTDNGSTWTLSVSSNVGASFDVAIVPIDSNNIGVLSTNETSVFFRKINVLTNSQIGMQTVDSSQIATGNVSLAINSAGTELHAAWSSKNSTYPNSFNIRYAKGTIDGSGNVTWGSVTQISTATGGFNQNPCIVVKGDGNPFIAYEGYNGSTYYTQYYRFSGSSWVASGGYNGGSYAQYNPCAVVDGNGVIHVVWSGFKSGDGANGIYYSKSTDGGVTWSLALNLTPSITNTQKLPSISVDNNNKLYVFFQGYKSGGSTYNIRRVTFDGSAWSGIVDVTNGTTADMRFPSAMVKESNSIIGFIYQDLQSSSVKFDSITLNRPPTLILTKPANNLSLVEGNAYQIIGSASDADAGNVVTVKFKIDGGTTYNITAAVSDGSTPINFNKTLTYLNSRLYDGQTPITPILDDQVPHTLTVWAEDDKGGKSADAVRNFTVLYNQPPQISGSDQDLGSIATPPSIQYSVTDVEHYSFTITEKVGDVTIRSFPGTDGQQETLTIPNDIWITLQPDVTHNLTITATDQYGASSTRTYTFKRIVDGIELETRTPLPADAQPYRMVLTLNAQYPQNAVVNVQVCNNGYDANPTWEDATSAVLNKRPYVFTNTSKTAENWGIKVKISISPGA